jgi:uncharacterized protein
VSVCGVRECAGRRVHLCQNGRMSAVERLVEVLHTWPGVRLAVLFGSAARDAEHPDDLDVGVWLESADVAGEVALRVALSRAARQDVDLVMLDSAPPLLRFEIARDGRPLVEGRPHAWADFRARAMIDWWDWAPTWRAMQQAAVNRLRQRVADGPS